MDSKELVDTIISICEDEKAVDLVVFNMNSKSILADYYLFCSCSSEVHIRGLVGTIEKELKDRFEMLPKSVEGKSASRWILVDYLDVLLHIFHPETRSYYQVEKLHSSEDVYYPEGWEWVEPEEEAEEQKGGRPSFLR